MNGSNHSAERDQQPLEFCPECQAKVWWTTKVDPAKRSRSLSAVAMRHGLVEEARIFARQAQVLGA